MIFEDWLHGLSCYSENFSDIRSPYRRVALAFWLSRLPCSYVCKYCTGCAANIMLLDYPWKTLPCPLVYKKELYYVSRSNED